MAHKKSHAGRMGLAGVAAAAAAAAGAYYFYGSKDAGKNRKMAAAWMKKAEAHVIKEAKKGVKIAHAKISAEIGKGVKEMKSVKKKMRK